MAAEPIDVTDTPFVCVTCVDCGTYVVAVPGQEADARCIECGRAEITHGWAVPIEIPADLAPPRITYPDPTYPPSPHRTGGVRVGSPDVAGRCLAHPLNAPDGDLRLMSLEPADVTVAYALHDQLHHRRTGWLVGGPGGATGDICNPCGGGNKDKTRMEQPRHDLCLRGNPRGGWGRNCPCTHDRPHMRGIKPGADTTSTAPTVDAVREQLAKHNDRPTIAIPTQGYLFDPEEDPDD